MQGSAGHGPSAAPAPETPRGPKWDTGLRRKVGAPPGVVIADDDGVRKLATVVVLMVLGASGLLSGTALVSDPSGATLGLDTGMLPSWHTWDYRLSGTIVLVALGIAPLVCVAALVLDAPGAMAAAGVIGVCTLGWVAVQIVVLDITAPRAQLALTSAGAVLLVAAASPAGARRR